MKFLAGVEELWMEAGKETATTCEWMYVSEDTNSIKVVGEM